MSDRLKVLYDERCELDLASKRILDEAEAEKRDLTAEDRQEWDRMDERINVLGEEIDRYERQLKRTEIMAQSRGRQSSPAQPMDQPLPTGMKMGMRTPKWRDKQGRSVAVLAPTERIVDHVRGAPVPNFSLGEAIVGSLTGDWRNLRSSIGASLQGVTDTAGGFLLPAPLSAMVLDAVRSQSVAIRAGVRTVPMESAELSIAKVDTDPVATWASEGVNVPDVEPVFGKLTLHARTCRMSIPIDEEWLADVADAVQKIEHLTIRTLALALDKAILFGGADGKPESPIGLRVTTGVNEQSSVGTPTDYSDFLTAYYTCLTEDAPEPFACVMHPRTLATLGALATGISGDKTQLAPPREWEAMDRFYPTSISIEEGTAESFALVGPFSEILVGIRLEAQIIVTQPDPNKYQRSVMGVLRADVGIPRPAYFVKLTGITAT